MAGSQSNEAKSLFVNQHRLPTVSASQTLSHLKSQGPRAIPTGVRHLDALLSGENIPTETKTPGRGGFLRGQIAEVWGPPGVGKTTVAMQACAAVLTTGKTVVWVDASSFVVLPRLQKILLAAKGADHECTHPTSSQEVRSGLFRNLHHHTTPTLPHLLALLLHPPASFPPPETALMVIDDVSTVFDNAYPRTPGDHPAANKSDAAKWTAGRKHSVLGNFIGKLGVMAALGDFAVLITTQTVTKVRTEGRALLLPAISGSEWESNISTRIALFRDSPKMSGEGGGSTELDKLRRVRFAGIDKAGGVTIADDGSISNVVPISIGEEGIEEISLGSTELNIAPLSSPVKARKRTHAEIADSEGSEEEYGWADEDEVAAEGLIDERQLIIDLTDTQPEYAATDG